MKSNQSKIEKLIEELCPNGVEFFELRKVCKVLRGKRLTKKELSNEYQYPVFHGGLIPLGCYNKYNRKANQTMVINTGSVGEVVWSPVDFWSSDGTFTIETSEIIDDRFVYFFLKCQEAYLKSQKREGGVPTIDREAVEKIKIPLPPLAIQEEIVKILDSFTELEAELEARKKQYEHYRNQLLVSDNTGKVQMVSLSDIADYSNTRIDAYKLNNENYVGVDNLLQDKQGKTISSYVPTTGRLTHYENGDILIGNIRPYLKKIWHATNEGGTNGDVLVIRINDKSKMNSEFLYYLLSSDKFFDYNMQFAKGAKMPRGDKSAIMKFEIPLPSPSEQERIVSILNKFELIVNDISIGLPAELKARRSQYEYYRGKLLTFNEIKK